MNKLNLFNTKKDLLLCFGTLAVLFVLHLGLKYADFNRFVSSNLFHEGKVLLVYDKINKHNKPYTIAKIKTKDFIIYSKISKDLKTHDKIRFKSFKKRLKFVDFLSKRFYTPIYKISILTQKDTHFKDALASFISKQHENLELKELYLALFLAKPIGKDLREKIQNWGISHLVAISGFHLGVIYASLFFVLKLFYGSIHDRFFAYKNINFQLGFLIFIFLGFYTYLLDYSPSFLRSFVMGILGFYLYLSHVKIFSFTNLALSGAILLVIFPHLVLSLSFWFSMMGVFYIFLYLHHFSFKKLDFLLINVWVYMGMIIPVHFFFAYTSFQQILSIFLSIAFIIFYPLSLVLHIFNAGYLFDDFMIWFLDIKFKGYFLDISLWLFVFYLVLSLFSIRNKVLAIFTIGFGFLYMFFV